jgi:hypothetical protein
MFRNQKNSHRMKQIGINKNLMFGNQPVQIWAAVAERLNKTAPLQKNVNVVNSQTWQVFE